MSRLHIVTLLIWLMCRVQFNSVQSLSHVRLFATPWIAARQASLSITNSQIMRNVGLDEAQAGIKIVGRNINNLRYADDPYVRKRRKTKDPLDESERGEWKIGLKLNIQKTKITASCPITSWQIDGETMGTVTDFIFEGFKITADGDWSHELKDTCSCEEKLWPI